MLFLFFVYFSDKIALLVNGCEISPQSGIANIEYESFSIIIIYLFWKFINLLILRPNKAIKEFCLMISVVC